MTNGSTGAVMPLPDPEMPSERELLDLAHRHPDHVGRTMLAAKLVDSVHPGSVLDVGCKSGWLLEWLAVGDIQLLVGADRNILDLRHTNRSARFRLVAANGQALPFVSERFEVVTLFEVIEHVPRRDETALLLEIRRVLRPGGLLFLSTPADWMPGTLLDPAWWLTGHRHYRRGTLVSLIRDAGLTPVLADTRGGWADVAGLPILYLATRLRFRMPASRRLRRWGIREYARPGRYTHFVVARKPTA
jgi:2-polyprenyl-3-methyl-5-hydroxy-6-metoxy-1,4-benzoquinol methylase